MNRAMLAMIRIAAATLLAVLAIGANAEDGHTAGATPNVFVVLLDDLGFSDYGFLGSEIRTPTIDGLAASGLTVSNFYVYPRCSPTRAALLTGRYPHDVGMGFLTTPDSATPEPGPYQGYLDHDAVTLAEMLKDRGYRTYLSGKWHLGEAPANWPRRHGFDRYFGLISGASSYFEIIVDQPLKRQMALDDDRWFPPTDGYYLTDEITDRAIEFLDQHFESDGASPFFLYLAYNAPHWPLHAPAAAIDAYDGIYDDDVRDVRRARIGSLREAGLLPDDIAPHDMAMTSFEHPDADSGELMAAYAAQVSVADAGIGRIVELLRDSGVAENTLILVMSDNGASAVDVSSRNLHQPGTAVGARGSYLSYGPDWSTVSNTPFFQHKGSTFEGGIRAPLIASWPAGLARPGRIDQASVLAVTDLYPTIAAVAGAPVPANVAGENFSALMEGSAFERRSPIFWEHLGWRAIRHGNWKAVFEPEAARWRLFDLDRDPLEAADLASSEPTRLADLMAQWQQWSDEVGTAGFDTESFMRQFQPRPTSR